MYNIFSFSPCCFVSIGNNKIKSSKDGNTIYLSSRELCFNSKSQVEWFLIFPDVSQYADCLQDVRESLNSDIVSNSFSEKNLKPVFAHQLFPSQTLATERSEFDEEKSSVLGGDIPARPIKGRGWSHIAHGKCVSDTQQVSSNAYQHSGYIVTPPECCMLQQLHYDRHD